MKGAGCVSEVEPAPLPCDLGQVTCAHLPVRPWADVQLSDLLFEEAGQRLLLFLCPSLLPLTLTQRLLLTSHLNKKLLIGLDMCTGEHVHRAAGPQTASWISASADGAQASSLVSPVLQKVLIGVFHWKQSPNLAQLAAPVASSASFLLGTRSLPPFSM